MPKNIYNKSYFDQIIAVLLHKLEIVLPFYYCISKLITMQYQGIGLGSFRMESNNSITEPGSPFVANTTIMHNRWLMAKKSLNMMEKMMDPNIIDYYIINCAIPSIVTIENRYQIDFGKPDIWWQTDRNWYSANIDYEQMVTYYAILTQRWRGAMFDPICRMKAIWSQPMWEAGKGVLLLCI